MTHKISLQLPIHGFVSKESKNFHRSASSKFFSATRLHKDCYDVCFATRVSEGDQRINVFFSKLNRWWRWFCIDRHFESLLVAAARKSVSENEASLKSWCFCFSVRIGKNRQMLPSPASCQRRFVARVQISQMQKSQNLINPNSVIRLISCIYMSHIWQVGIFWTSQIDRFLGVCGSLSSIQLTLSQFGHCSSQANLLHSRTDMWTFVSWLQRTCVKDNGHQSQQTCDVSQFWAIVFCEFVHSFIW